MGKTDEEVFYLFQGWFKRRARVKAVYVVHYQNMRSKLTEERWNKMWDGTKAAFIFVRIDTENNVLQTEVELLYNITEAKDRYLGLIEEKFHKFPPHTLTTKL